MFSDKNTLLLDMNGTFMFGEDNFDSSQDFSKHYYDNDGTLEPDKINNIIRSVYTYLDSIYADIKFRHHFPSIKNVLKNMENVKLTDSEISKIIDTFAYHEMGFIPDEYIEVLHILREKYKLAVVIDIWAPKTAWLQLFEKLGIDKLFSASSFSSDHGMVKPSPKPFELVVENLAVQREHCLMIGDSIRRDLGGANAAGIDCVLVGGEKHPLAVGSSESLIELSHLL